jgi:hypothetical protein
MPQTRQHSEKPDFDKVWLMFQETDRKFQETNRILETKFQDTDKKFQETDKKIKELGKQIGGLGNKFGSFNEGLLMPSLKNLFHKTFGCKVTTENFRFRDNGNEFEIDLLGISKTECYILEIKSHLDKDAVKQLTNQVNMFRQYALEAEGKKLHGVIAATHFKKEERDKVTSKGIYFISTSDDMVKLEIPDDFKPKAW